MLSSCSPTSYELWKKRSSAKVKEWKEWREKVDGKKHWPERISTVIPESACPGELLYLNE